MRVAHASAASLVRAIAKVEKRHMREGLACLSHHRSLDTCGLARSHALAIGKLADFKMHVAHASAASLVRAIAKVEKRHMREGLARLSYHHSLDTFVLARSHAEDMLQRLHGLVDSFDSEVDHLVEDILQGTFADDDVLAPRS